MTDSRIADDDAELGQVLKAEREAAGMTQEELAERLNELHGTKYRAQNVSGAEAGAYGLLTLRKRGLDLLGFSVSRRPGYTIARK